MIRVKAVFLQAAAAMAVLSIVTAPCAYGAGRESVDGIVAIVNDVPITLYQVKQRAEILKQRYPDESRLDRRALDDLIDDDIIYGELKTMGVTINQGDIDSAVEQMAESNGVSVGALRKDLNGKGISFDAYEEGIKSELARSKLVGYKFRTEITVTEDDIQRYYIEHRKEFSQVKQADIRHILIEVPPDSSDDRKQSLLKEANSVRAELDNQDGGEEFSAAAAKYSDDRVTKSNGGELGYVEQGTLYPVIDKAIFTARPGEVIGPLRTPIGYEIIVVNAFKSSELLPLNDVKDKIRNNIYTGKLDAALKSWLLTKRQKTIITVYDGLL
jgi:parvulin-like peptidyl-prolyl isomerase